MMHDARPVAIVVFAHAGLAAAGSYADFGYSSITPTLTLLLRYASILVDQ